MKPDRECDSYGWEKLYLATRQLVKEGTQRERVSNAYYYELMKVDPDTNLPIEIRNRFRTLVTNIEKVKSLNDDEVNNIALEIVELYDTATRYQGPFDSE